MCSYKSLLPQSCSQYSQMESRTRQECAVTSPYCLSPAVITQREREELDRNVQLQVLIASVLQLVLTDKEKNQIGMCSYKYLLPQSGSNYTERERRTRQQCATTSPYCLSPVVSTKRQREELDRNVQLQVLIASVLTVGTHRQREELDRNVQLQVLIASALQSVLKDRDQNQIGMCSYKSLLPQSCSQYSETGRRTRQECAATSPYCLSPAVGTHRQREELDRNVQLQVLIASVLHIGTHREREELDRNVQLQVLIASVLTVGTHRHREELDRNVQLQVLIASVLTLVLIDTEKNQIGMVSYKSLLPQSCSQYSEREQNQIGICSYKSLLPQS